MLRIGAHMSVAGGVSRAVERAMLHGCESLQIFTKNASQWKGKPLDDDEVRRFREAVDRSGIGPVVSHASYLINLATANEGLRRQSIEALVDEFARATRLGLAGVVIHPGTCTSGSVEDALRRIGEAVRVVFAERPHDAPLLLFEHTAGQGRTLGSRIEHLASLLLHLDGSPRVGVCLDTCHLVASGYDIASEAGYEETMQLFDRLVGFDRLEVIHANDSKKPCGSRVDRHEHIGLGCLGLDPFRRLLHDSRVAGRPLIIETAKSKDAENPRTITIDPLDVRNLETLRRLRDDHA
ncbi:MAG: deoxyribonuclease IV [Vicinamibacterales bacterium]